MAVDYKVLRVPAEEIGELPDFEAWLNLQGADDWDISHISPNRVITFVKGAGGGISIETSNDNALITWNNSLSAWESTYVLDDSLSASSTTVWTSERITQLVESEVIGLFDYKGGYDANTNTPDIIGIGNNEKGDVYTVEVGGTFLGETVESGDMIVAEIDDATVRADFTIVNKNIDLIASEVDYVNITSSLSSENVQDAIDEIVDDIYILSSDIYDDIDNLSASDISYINTTSSLSSENVQDAIDEIVDDIYILSSDIYDDIDNLSASDISYDPSNISPNPLSATNVQDAIDEIVDDYRDDVFNLDTDLQGQLNAIRFPVSQTGLTADTTLDSFPHEDSKGTVKWLIQIDNGAVLRSSEIVANYNLSAVEFNEYGIIENGGTYSGASLSAIGDVDDVNLVLDITSGTHSTNILRIAQW